MSCNGLTTGVLKLWIEAFDKKSLTFKKQTIYKSSQRYYDAVGLLKSKNILRPICNTCLRTLEEDEYATCHNKDRNHKTADPSIKYYGLTWTGWFLGRGLKRFFVKKML